MALKIDALNREIRNRVKAGKANLWSHGNGLCFALAKNGRADWVYRFTINGKRRVMTLAAHSDPISEKDYKSLELRAIELRDLVKSGADPLAQRLVAKRAPAGATGTFREVAESYIAAKRGGWKSPVHADQWETTLKQFVYPHVGNMKPHEIRLADVLRVLQQPHKKRALWEAIPETAARIRARIEIVINAAKAKGIGSENRETRALWDGHINPAVWEDNLEHWLPVRQRTEKKPLAAMNYVQLPALIAELKQRRELSTNAMLMTIFTAVRTSECLEAEWSEFDLDAAVWTIPATRMKGGKEHVVPLSDAAIALLKSTPKFLNNPLVFPGARRGKTMSRSTMLHSLKSMKGSGQTMHGMRASFRTWVAETTLHSRDVAEMALAHKVGSEVERSYQRGTALKRRAILMQQWSDYLTMNKIEYETKWQKYIAVIEDDIAA